jgi:uncharacterized membrane protein
MGLHIDLLSCAQRPGSAGKGRITGLLGPVKRVSRQAGTKEFNIRGVEGQRERLLWKTIFVGIPLLVLIAILAGPVLFSDRLPDDVAVHWGFDGKPNGSMPKWVPPALLTAIWVATWVGLLSSARHSSGRSSGVDTTYGIGALLAGVSILITSANLDAHHWSDVDTDLWGVVLVIGVSLVLGAAGNVLERLRATHAPVSETTARPITSKPPTRKTWIGRERLPYLVLLVGGIGIGGPLLGLIPIPIALVLVVVFIEFARVTVTITAQEVDIALGPLKWPRRRVPIKEIVRADAVRVRPLQYGGTGYRLAGKAIGYIIRGGEGIDIETAGRRHYVVTIDGADEAAAAINYYASS